MDAAKTKTDKFSTGIIMYGPLSASHKTQIIIGAAIGLTCGYGPFFLATAGIFLKSIAVSFNWSRTDVSILPMLSMIGSAIGAPLIGYIADRTGWKKVIAVSIVLFSLGLLAISAAPPSKAYFSVIGFLIGIVGVATSPPGYNTIVSLVFDRRLGMALGFAAVGIGVGVLAMPIIAANLLEAMDWRQAYLCVAGSALLLGAVAHQLIFRILDANRIVADANRDDTVRASMDSNTAVYGDSFSQAIRNYRFWLIGVVTALVAGTTLATMIHLVSYATDRGVSLVVAAQSAGLMGLGIAVTRLAVGLILDKIFAPIVALATFLLSAAGFYLITGDILRSTWLLPLAVILIGISQSAEGDLIPFLTKKYFGARAFGSIYGALFAFIPIGSALGIYLYGWSFDLLQSYIPIFQTSALLLCICSVTMLMLGRYRYKISQHE